MDRIVLHLDAPAKINLFLEVTGKRPDGYHELASIMQTVSLYDHITITSSPRLSLVCNRKDLPCDERNLAMKAALMLRRELGVQAGARIKLEKNIPMGAGLGGGSSDAASVLKGLLRLWRRRMPHKDLARLASRLGADVPFFLKGGTAYAKGIGDILKPVKNVRPAWYVLVYPGFPVATAWVYKQLSFPLTKTQKINKIKRLLESGAPSDVWGRQLHNRLENVVFPAFPAIENVKGLLVRNRCLGIMSGSGSTVVGIVGTRNEGENVRSVMLGRDWDVWVVRSIF